MDDVKYFFIDWIEPGDVYEEGVFKKTIHGPGASDVVKTFQDYYLEYCKTELGKLIVNKINQQYNVFLSMLLTGAKGFDFPLYMIAQYENPITRREVNLDGVDKIDLTEEYYKEARANGIKETSLNMFKETLKGYGYTLTSAAENAIEIEELV